MLSNPDFAYLVGRALNDNGEIKNSLLFGNATPALPMLAFDPLKVYDIISTSTLDPSSHIQTEVQLELDAYHGPKKDQIEIIYFDLRILQLKEKIRSYSKRALPANDGDETQKQEPLIPENGF